MSKSTSTPTLHKTALLLTPLVAALAASLPLAALAQSRVTAPPPPVARTVPVPAAGWRVYGSGAAAPVNTGNARGGVDMSIAQTSQRAIYNWQSFDIAADSSVTFDMALPGSSALNRIASVSPSQIFGQLKATNGGEILLYNRNGILFGKDARVDVGALMATTLAPSNADYANGFVPNITGGNPALRYDGAPADYVDAKNFIRVEPGAEIKTGEGGRIQLYAKRVENAGTLTAPGGQVVLGAGAEVFYKLPTAEPLYASEVNANVPALRGLLVEVGRGELASGAGSVEHSGSISVPRGNATLVGLAVNQKGRINATTSVSQNGSILLLAQGDAQSGKAVSDPSYKRATTSGELVLAAGSVTEITPDNLGADGKPLTSDDNASFTRSRLHLSGGVIDVQGRITAPGAQAELRALHQPDYEAGLLATTPLNASAGRLLIGNAASIDLAGTTDATVSAGRNFVTTELLGSNDLKDAPLQKDGLLYRNKVTLDIRQASPILGDLANYRAGLQRSASERLASGGNLRLVAGEAVVVQAGSALSVAGGRVSYTDALVAPTQLYASNGAAYTLNTAPRDLVYTAITNAGTAKARFDRWGPMVSYGTVSPVRLETGYVEGRAGGSLTLVAPSVSLAGQLHGATLAGSRQRLGQDALPAAGQLVIGALVHNAAFGTGSYAGAVLRRFALTAGNAPAADALSLQTLRDAGFGSVSVTAVGDVRLGGDVDLPALGTLRLQSQQGKVDVAGSVHAPGGQVTLRSLEGDVTVAGAVRLDVSGAWVNAALDPLLTASAPAAATKGGSLSLQAGGGLDLADGSVLDVSGGALVGGSSSASGGAAGSITLAAGPTAPGSSATAGLRLGASLYGYSLAQGASLNISAPALRLGSTTPATADAAGTLRLGEGFLDRGGFQSFSFQGRESLVVETGATLAPRPLFWQLTAASRLVASGSSHWRDTLVLDNVPLGYARPVTLGLASGGYTAADAQGELTIAAGATISLAPTSRIDLSARHRLRMDGSLIAPAGQVNLGLGGGSTADQARWLWLGSSARIDVAGRRQLLPGSDGLLTGRVLGGGSIGLNAAGSEAGFATSLVVQQGARLDVSGASGLLDLRERTAGGERVSRQLIGSTAGSLSAQGNGLMLLEGDLNARGGSGQLGGRLQVALGAGYRDPSQPPPLLSLVLAASDGQLSRSLSANGLGGATTTPLLARVDAPWLTRSGIGELSLNGRERIAIEGGVSLALDRALTLDSAALAVSPLGSSAAALLSAPLLSWANSKTALVIAEGGITRDAPTASSGDGTLTLQAGERLDVSGQVVSQGIAQLHLDSRGDLLLQKPGTSLAGEGRLTTAADLALNARQLYPATDTGFTIEATGRSIVIGKPDGAAPDLPWSAGGRLTLQAATIVQGGRLRAPEGSLTLKAGESLQLLDGSETTVSANGRSQLFGTWNGERWFTPGSALGTTSSAVPPKAVVLDAPRVRVAPGAKLDLSGGGQLLSWQFVAGPGGSTDIFSAADGSYAIVPGVHSSGATDASLPGMPALGRQINFGATGLTLPDGTELRGSYTLLPARFALLPGALLVRPASGTALSVGHAIQRDDGTLLVGARLGQAGTTVLDALASNWQVLTPAKAQRYSEIRLAGADAFFSALAQRSDAATPALNRDAGALVVAARQADIQGALRFAAAQSPTGERGLGGSAYFDAAAIEVGDNPSDTGSLRLGIAQLNALGVDRLVLGAVPTDLQRPASLDVRTQTVRINDELPPMAQAGQPQDGKRVLTAPTLLLAARQDLEIKAGAALQAQSASGTPTATDWTLSGDGAAVLLSANAASSLQRQGAALDAGNLVLQGGASLQAASGRVQLDATGHAGIAAGATLNASALGLGAPRLQLGGSQPLADDSLLLGSGLLSQLGTAADLLLRSYSSLDLVGTTSFGTGADGRATLGRLTLDTPALRAATADDQAHLQARSLVLTNSTGSDPAAAAANGQIKLTSDGLLQVGPGKQAWQAAQADLAAPAGLVITGNSELSATGNVTASAGVVSAGAAGTAPARSAWTVAGALQLLAPADANTSAAPRGVAAQLALTAQSLSIATDIDLPAGQLSLASSGDLTIQRGRLGVAGRSDSISSGGQTLRADLAAGSLTATSSGGNLVLGQAAQLDVSGAGDGDAGRLSLNAPAGSLTLAGTLRGAASNAAVTAASLSLDSRAAVDLGALSQAIAGAGNRAFEQQIAVRNRSGDQTLHSGARLAAHSINLASDTGSLTIAGELIALASGTRGGQIQLDAGADAVIAEGARLMARNAGTGSDSDASRIALNSRAGWLRLQGGAINLEGGELSLRALRDGQDVKIAPLQSRLQQVGSIDIEAVQVYGGIGELVAGLVPAPPAPPEPPPPPPPPAPEPPAPQPPAPQPPAPQPPAPQPPAPQPPVPQPLAPRPANPSPGNGPSTGGTQPPAPPLTPPPQPGPAVPSPGNGPTTGNTQPPTPPLTPTPPSAPQPQPPPPQPPAPQPPAPQPPAPEPPAPQPPAPQPPAPQPPAPQPPAPGPANPSPGNGPSTGGTQPPAPPLTPPPQPGPAVPSPGNGPTTGNTQPPTPPLAPTPPSAPQPPAPQPPAPQPPAPQPPAPQPPAPQPPAPQPPAPEPPAPPPPAPQPPAPQPPASGPSQPSPGNGPSTGNTQPPLPPQPPAPQPPAPQPPAPEPPAPPPPAPQPPAPQPPAPEPPAPPPPAPQPPAPQPPAPQPPAPQPPAPQPPAPQPPAPPPPAPQPPAPQPPAPLPSTGNGPSTGNTLPPLPPLPATPSPAPQPPAPATVPSAGNGATTGTTQPPAPPLTPPPAPLSGSRALAVTLASADATVPSAGNGPTTGNTQPPAPPGAPTPPPGTPNPPPPTQTPPPPTAPAPTGQLGLARVVADNDAFMGAGQQTAQSVTTRVMAAQPAALAATVRVRAGVEVQNSGDIVVAADWRLPTLSNAQIAAAPNAAEAALTLRTSGDVKLQSSLSTGLRESPTVAGTWVATSSRAGAIRIAAGADLGAANPMAMRTDAVTGSIRIGNAPANAPTVQVRSSTGRIELAAAADIRWLDDRATIATLGVPVAATMAAATPQATARATAATAAAATDVPSDGNGPTTGDTQPPSPPGGTVTPPPPPGPAPSPEPAPPPEPTPEPGTPDPLPTTPYASLLENLAPALDSSGLLPFTSGGGAIKLTAGQDIVGRAATPQQLYATGWLWRAEGTLDRTVAWFARSDLFAQGVATLGGGSVQVQAGRDALQVHAAAAGSGFIAASSDLPAGLQQFGGGSVSLRAGRDVVSGQLLASRGIDVTAGASIVTQAGADINVDPGLQLIYQDGAMRVQAGGDATLASARNFALARPSNANKGALGDGVATPMLDAGSRLLVQSAAGSVSVPGAGQPLENSAGGEAAPGLVVPVDVRLLASQGGVSAGNLWQWSAVADPLQARTWIAGRDAVSVDNLRVLALGLPQAPAGASMVELATVTLPEAQRFTRNALGQAQLDQTPRDPALLLSASGDVALQNLSSSRPVVAAGGRDVRVSNVSVQQQPAAPGKGSELTLLQAGRDVRFGNGTGLEIAGPGDLLVLAGRDVDLATSTGIVARGNLSNGTLLPEGGARLSVVAGLGAEGEDYAHASAAGFQVLGASGMATRLGQAWVLLGGSGTAAAFDAATPAEQLNLLRQRFGAAVVDGLVAEHVKSQPARAEGGDQRLRMAALLGKPVDDPAVTDALKAQTDLLQPAWSALGSEAALQQLDKLGSAQQTLLVSRVLMDGLARQTPTARSSALAQLAATADIAKLADYVALMGGARGTDAADTLRRFEALPLELQIPWLNRVLVGELRSAGRAAAVLEGDERWAAYARGYQAVNLLFPLGATGRPTAQVRMPTSQIKTLQSADITLLNPGGGVNAGEVTGGAKAATELGIVTVNGGDVSAIVQQNFEVNQSRVFTLGRGSLLMWSSAGNIDAGRGAKTVTGAPAPVLRLDNNGNLVFDTSGSFSGSGIAVLSAGSDLDLYAPTGEINAGEAGIRSKGNAFLGADRLANANDIQVAGTRAGTTADVPIAAPIAVPTTPTGAAQAAAAAQTDTDKDERRRRRRNLLLEFLGFGSQ